MQAKKSLAGVAMLTLTLGLAGGAHAQLFKRDLLAGDQLLVFDNASGLEWLQPSFTRYDRYMEGPAVRQVMENHGFRYASFDEARSMILDNFGAMPQEPSPADLPGGLAADRFFEWFGPTWDNPEIKAAYGMTAPVTGNYPGIVSVTKYPLLGTGSFSALQQGDAGLTQFNLLGSWLVRPVSPVPEPASALLMLSGLGVVGWWRRNRGRE